MNEISRIRQLLWLSNQWHEKEQDASNEAQRVGSVPHSIIFRIEAEAYARCAGQLDSLIQGWKTEPEPSNRSLESIRSLLKELEDLYQGRVVPHTRCQAVIEEARDILLSE